MLIMILLVHIAIALCSVAFSTYLFFQPTDRKFQISYSLVALTIASGTLLVFLQPAHMSQACVSGLVYISFVLVALVAAHRKLSKQYNS